MYQYYATVIVPLECDMYQYYATVRGCITYYVITLDYTLYALARSSYMHT